MEEMSIRNFWIEATIHGEKYPFIKGGPEKGGMHIRIHQLHEGRMKKVLVLSCDTNNEKLSMEVRTEDSSKNFTITTTREEKWKKPC